MTKRQILIIVLGAVPATVFSVLALNIPWQTHWNLVAWIGTIALWGAAWVPDYSKLPTVLRWVLALGLALGIFLAVFPAGMNILYFVEYALALDLLEILMLLGLITALLAPIATSVYCLISIFRRPRPVS